MEKVAQELFCPDPSTTSVVWMANIVDLDDPLNRSTPDPDNRWWP